MKTNNVVDILQILHNITKLITKELVPENLLPLVSRELKQILSFDRISIAIYNQSNKTFELRAIVIDSPVGNVFKGSFPGPGSRTYLSMSERRTIYFKNLLNKKDFFETNYLIDEGYLSGLNIPLIVGSNCFGTLNFNSKTVDAFSPEIISFLESVAEPVAIAMHNAIAFEELNKIRDRLCEENRYLVENLKYGPVPPKFVGSCKTFLDFTRQLEIVANSNATVLLHGETGTGKELAAEYIHDKSQRADKPLIKVDCAAMPAELLESELFGHTKGSFTGATKDKIGKFEIANEGTLFLDEISELELELQSKLLRVLQDHTVTKIGSNYQKRLDIRIIAATNRHLEDQVNAGKFRKDLFFRLNVFPIEVPPLRKRIDDLPDLLDYFIRKFSIALRKSFNGISPESVRLMSRYSWPGNIRELANLVERSCILTLNGNMITVLPKMLTFKDTEHYDVIKPLSELERDHIIKALLLTKGKVNGKAGAASYLKIHPNTLRSRLKKHGIIVKKLVSDV